MASSNPVVVKSARYHVFTLNPGHKAYGTLYSIEDPLATKGLTLEGWMGTTNYHSATSSRDASSLRKGP